MIDQEHEKIRAVAWSEIFPWLNIFRTFRLAIRIRALLLATAAMLLIVHGWAFIDLAFSGGDAISELKLKSGTPWTSLTNLVPDRPHCPFNTESAKSAPVAWANMQVQERFPKALLPQAGFVNLAHALVCGLWAVLISAWFAGAITRSASLELAADERIGNGELYDFVKRRWRAYFAAPLFPLLGVLLATIGIGIVGLFLNANLGIWIAAILWPFLLIGGLMMAVLLLGLWFGWPLMWPTISSEGTDSFDALSRTYAYVFQKPLHYLFYIIVAGLFGILSWLLVSNFAAAVIMLTDWAASWGCGSVRLNEIVGQDGSLGLGSWAAALIHIWRDCVKLLAVGFLYSYFWTAATAIYFLLRRGVDATEMDEVYTEDEQGDEIFGLPKVENDEQGAPVVNDSADAQPADEPAGE